MGLLNPMGEPSGHRNETEVRHDRCNSFMPKSKNGAILAAFETNLHRS